MKRSAPLKRSAPMKRTAGLRRDTSARLTVPVLKTRKCKECRERFTPTRPMQVACGPDCAQAIGLKARARAEVKARADEKKADRAKREAMKTLPELIREAQEHFNRYVRFRDTLAGHGCIDCGQPFEPNTLGGSMDAGHYLSRGSSPHLRFDERNMHAQRKNCNRPGGATRGDFRAGLVARIGLATVEALEADQVPRKYSRDEVRTLRDTYRRKALELRKKLAAGDELI